MTTGSPLGDVLRAWQLLDAGDAETRARIAALLGTVWTPPKAVVIPLAQSAQPQTPTASVPTTSQPADPTPPTRTPRKISIEIAPPADGEPTADEVLGSESMEVQRELAPFPPRQPLLNPKWMRGILSSRLSQSVPSRRLDFAAILRHELRATPLRRLPWRRVLTMSAGVRCYIDASAPIDILADDRVQVLRALRALAGFERVSFSFFETIPDADQAAAGTESQMVTAPDAPILLLTDFGHYSLPGRRWASPYEWLAYIERERTRGTTHIVALTPLAPADWPAALTPEIDIVRWDWQTGVGQSRRHAS